MSDKLEQLQQEYADKLKRLKLLDAGVDHSDVDVYVKYLKSDDEQELEEEAQAIVADIKQQNTAQDSFGDPSQGTTWKIF